MNRFNDPNYSRQKKTCFIILLVLIFNFISFIPIYGQVQEVCNLGDLPSLVYKGSSTIALSNDNKAILGTVAAKLKENPFCSIWLNGYPPTSKSGQANCQKRLETIKIYLIEKEGISGDRISTNCEPGAGDPNTVDIKQN